MNWQNPIRLILALLATLSAEASLCAQGMVDIRISNSSIKYEQTLQLTLRQAQYFHSRLNSLNGGANIVQQKYALYNNLASKMSAPGGLEHIPFPPKDPEREWTTHAFKVANGIKPKINYQVQNGPTVAIIQGSDAAVKNIKDNVRMIAWYRDQIDKTCIEEQNYVGDHALGRLIDEYLEEIADAIPEIRIKMNGRMNIPRDQKLDYSESTLWGILSAVNRYFFYKIQIYSERNDFQAADYLLMNSMMKTASLYGASPPTTSLEKMELGIAKPSKGWRGAAYDALNAWKMELNSEHSYPQKICSIAIPSKPKPAPPKPPKPAPQFPEDVEDIKEINGQLFIKRKGKWQPWPPK